MNTTHNDFAPVTIRATSTIPAGWSEADLHAAILSGQHERALIDAVSVNRVADGLAAVTVHYGAGAGAGEIQEVVDRLVATPHVTMDAVRVTTR